MNNRVTGAIGVMGTFAFSHFFNLTVWLREKTDE